MEFIFDHIVINVVDIDKMPSFILKFCNCRARGLRSLLRGRFPSPL